VYLLGSCASVAYVLLLRGGRVECGDLLMRFLHKALALALLRYWLIKVVLLDF